MKKIVLLAALILATGLATAQADEDKNFRIPLIGEKAPSFSAKTTNGDLVLFCAVFRPSKLQLSDI